MLWIVSNWWWISPVAVPLLLGGLKYAAKKTKWVGDDKIVTLLAGVWDMSRGIAPRSETGKK
jgi:hypothetical protein